MPFERVAGVPVQRVFTEAAIIAAIKAFMAREGRPPRSKDFCRRCGLPTRTLVDRRMGNWQEAVRQALQEVAGSGSLVPGCQPETRDQEPGTPRGDRT